MTGEARLAIRPLVRTLALYSCVSLMTAGWAAGQAVVPPGDTYVEGPGTTPAGSIARWALSDEGPRVIRVYFTAPPDHRPDFWAEARHALQVWEDVSGAPLKFEASVDPAVSDVDFVWIDRFPTSQAGSTHRRLDDSGRIEHVTVTLAVAHSDGVAMSPEFVRLVALHEVGHVVGLPHSENPGDAMHPGNRNLELSPRDIRSVEVLYRLPDSSGR